MPPVLQPEVPLAAEKGGKEAPVPTWSYRRDTLPQESEEGPPKLRRMVPTPMVAMMKEEEQRKAGVQGPPVLQPAVSSGGVTHVTSTVHQSGGTVRPANPVAPAAGAGKPAPRIMRISKEDYLRLVAENKIKIVQQAPGVTGQVIRLQPGLSIKPKLAPSATVTSPPTSATVVSSSVSPSGDDGSPAVAVSSTCSVSTTVSSGAPRCATTFSAGSEVPAGNSSVKTVAKESVADSSQSSSAMPVLDASQTPSCQASTSVTSPSSVKVSSSASVTPGNTPSSVSVVPSEGASSVSQKVPPSTDSKVVSEESVKGSRVTATDAKKSTSHSHKQGADNTKKEALPSSSAQRSEQSVSGSHRTDKISEKQSGASRPGKRKHGEDSEVTTAKVSRNTEQDSVTDSTHTPTPKECSEMASSSQQKAMPKINLTGLSSQLASAMAKKRDHPSDKAPFPKHQAAESSGSVNSGEGSVEVQDQENLTGDVCADNRLEEDMSTPSSQHRDETAMEVEESPPSQPPPSSNGKGLFECMADGGKDNTARSELTPPRPKVNAPGSKGSTPGSGSRGSKSPLKHADSNIFQRMLDFTNEDVTEKVRT